MIVSREGVREKMPAAHPEEFRRRAVELARLREKPIAKVAKDLGISESCLRRWMDLADVEEGHKEGLTRDERAELCGCAEKSGFWRWKWRSSNGPAPTSPGTTSSQNRVPAGPRAGCAGLPCRADRPDPAGVDVRLP